MDPNTQLLDQASQVQPVGELPNGTLRSDADLKANILVVDDRPDKLLALEAVRSRMRGNEPAVPEIDRRIADLRHRIGTSGFAFDRRFLFRCLSMGHSQFAEIIGARGPNTQINSACASTTQAMAVAEDWIRAGRCRRVVVVAADDVTSETLLPWMAAGFLASGAAATDDVAAEAATPFDRRRHGMIVGMGAAAVVVESADAARERGIQPICEVLGAVTANSAYHGTRLDVEHIGQVMETLVRQAEARGVDRYAIAGQTLFMSHETYTPARGGSAAAEINAHYHDASPLTFRLHDAQLVLARAYGFDSWPRLKAFVDGVTVKRFEEAARNGDLAQLRAMLQQRPELVNSAALRHAVLRRDDAMVRRKCHDLAIPARAMQRKGMDE